MGSQVIHVLLAGGRLIPNIIGAMLLKPDRVEIVASRDEPGKIAPLLKSLRAIPGLVVPRAAQVPRVDAFDYRKNLAALERIVGRYPPESALQFNLTCSTKIMALAAYDVAHLHANTRAFYVDSAHGLILWLGEQSESTRIHPFSFTIQDYLRGYGRRPAQKFRFAALSFSQPAALAAAEILAGNPPGSGKLLERIRQSQSKGKGLAVSLAGAGEAELGLAAHLHGLGVLGCQDGVLRFHSNEDMNFFVGGWLEAHAWDQARRLAARDGSPLFDECALGLEIPCGPEKKELDLVCMFQGQLIHASCKAGDNPFKTRTLDELAAVSSLIGGRFCSRLFISPQAYHDEKEAAGFKDHAFQREIVVVAGQDLKKLGEILAREAAKPTYPRI